MTSWRFHNRALQPQRHDRLSETSGTLWIHWEALTNQRCSLATGCGIKLLMVFPDTWWCNITMILVQCSQFTIATTAVATTATAAAPDDRSYTVPVECRDDLARSRGLPACSEVNVTQMLLPCELREAKDTQLLIQVAAVSGFSEVHTRTVVGSISNSAKVFIKSQESKQGQFVAACLTYRCRQWQSAYNPSNVGQCENIIYRLWFKQWILRCHWFWYNGLCCKHCDKR